MKEGEKEFKPSKLYRSLDLDDKGVVDIFRPVPEDFAGNSKESKEWFKKIKEEIADAPMEIGRLLEKGGSWLEAFSAVLFSIETKMFDPRFENGAGKTRCGEIRDNVVALRNEVNDLLKLEKESKWQKLTPEDSKQELLAKMKELMSA